MKEPKKTLRKIPKSARSAWVSLCSRAKTHGDLVHPDDQNVICEFIIICNRVGSGLDGSDFYDHLIAEGVHEEVAMELTGKYEFGRRLLRVRREHFGPGVLPWRYDKQFQSD